LQFKIEEVIRAGVSVKADEALRDTEALRRLAATLYFGG